MDKRIFVLGATAIVSASAGVVTGWQLCKRKLIEQYDAQLERDRISIKWSYEQLYTNPKANTVEEQMERRAGPMRTGPMKPRADEPSEDTLERTLAGLKRWDTGEQAKIHNGAAEAMVAYSAGAVQADQAVVILDRFQKPSILGLGYSGEEVVERGLFNDTPSSDVDLSQFRRPGHPYVVSVRDFEFGDAFSQSELTWYEEDRVLSDDQDMPVPDVDGVVGLENMERFGMGSDDPNLVYIWNEKLRTMFEVFRNEGSYAKIVQGAIDPPERQPKRRPKEE